MTDWGRIAAVGIVAVVLVCHVQRKKINGVKFYRIFIPALIAVAALVTWLDSNGY